jgi:hypothetical protein
VGSFHQAAVEVKTEFSHGVSFVEVGPGKKFGSESTEHVLGRREDYLIAFAPPGNVEQAK